MGSGHGGERPASDQAAAAMMNALNWAYERAASALPGLGSAADLASACLARSGGSSSAAIKSLIARQVGYAGAAGFVTNLGGFATMPLAIPANLASVLLIQLRMITAIAILRGYEVSDQRVRTLAFLCLTGSKSAAVLQEMSIRLGVKVTERALMKISGATLTRINEAIGFKLVGRAGTTGLINLSKVVPVLGGVIGGGFDAAVTRGIAAAATRAFPPIEAEPAAADLLPSEIPILLPPPAPAA
jgi:EcsC protein family